MSSIPTKKKSRNDGQKPPNISAVFGPIDSEEAFKEFIELVKTNVGGYRSHYYRAGQKCGFIYFHDEPSTQAAIQAFNNSEFHDETLTACAPRDYFEDEADARPVPANSSRTPVAETLQSPDLAMALNLTRRPSHGAVLEKAGEPDVTLVLKNLPSNLRHDKLMSILKICGATPHTCKLQRDEDGTFRHIAFVTYESLDKAKDALEKLAGLEIGKRKLKVAFKRKASTHNLEHASPPHTVHFALPNDSVTPEIGNLPPAARNRQIHGDATTGIWSNLSPAASELLKELQRFKASPFASELSVPVFEDLVERNVVHNLAECLDLVHITHHDQETDSMFVIIRKQTPTSGRRNSVDPKRFVPMVDRPRLFSVPNLPKGPDQNSRGFHAKYRKNSLSNDPARSERRSIAPGYSIEQS